MARISRAGGTIFGWRGFITINAPGTGSAVAIRERGSAGGTVGPLVRASIGQGARPCLAHIEQPRRRRLPSFCGISHAAAYGPSTSERIKHARRAARRTLHPLHFFFPSLLLLRRPRQPSSSTSNLDHPRAPPRRITTHHVRPLDPVARRPPGVLLRPPRRRQRRARPRKSHTRVPSCAVPP